MIQRKQTSGDAMLNSKIHPGWLVGAMLACFTNGLGAARRGLSARRNALADAVARLSHDAEKRVQASNQEMIEHLQAQVKLREEQLARMRQLYQAATVSSSEVSKAQSDVEEAKIQL